MSKAKRGKSGNASDTGNWETELVKVAFVEAEWKPLVIFLNPDKYCDTPIVNLLGDTIKTGLRKLFTVIDHDKLLTEAKEIAAQLKGGKGKGAQASPKPLYGEICEQVKALSDQGDIIPIITLAKLVKFKLISIKTKDKERRENEKKITANASRSKLDNTASKTGSPTRARSQSPGKGGKKGGKKDSDKPVSPKKDTKLKKRGEENDITETIDDEPDGPNDPQLYIILTGFHEAVLTSAMIDLKININAIINLKTEYNAKLECALATENAENDNVDIDETSTELNNVKVEEELKKMWMELDLISKHAPTGHPLQDMAKFEIFVKEDCFPDQLKEAFEPKSDFAGWLFDKVAGVCYDLLDYTEQYERYVDNLKIIDVSPNPDFIEKNLSNFSSATVDSIQRENSYVQSEKQEQAPPPCDLRYYDKLMSNVHVQSESVPLILDCLLEQVVANSDGLDPLEDEIQESRPDGLNHLLGQFWDRKMAIVGAKDNHKLWKNEKTKKSTPDIVYHSDLKRLKLLKIKDKNQNFPAEQIEEKMRSLHPYSCFTQYLQPSEEDWMENRLRRRQLYNFCHSKNSSISEEKFERAMKQYIFESLPIEVAAYAADTEQNEDAAEEQLEKILSRWDYPYHDAGQPISDCRVQQHLGEWQAQQPVTESHDQQQTPPLEPSNGSMSDNFYLRRLDNYNWLEQFEPSILYQVLDEGSQLRPYLDTYYNRGNNTLLVVLHNPTSDNLENTFQWDSWLHSDVGFRNYLEHVALQIQDWTLEKQRIADELENAQKSSEIIMPTSVPPPIKEQSRWGLKTRAELKAEKDAEAIDKNNGKKNRSRSASPRKSKSPDKKKSETKTRKPSAKKSSRAGTASKRPGSNRSKVSFTTEDQQSSPLPPSSTPTISKPYAFVGYNLGDEILHVNIDQSYLFPKNGALVRVERLSYTQQSSTTQVTVMYKGDTFSINFSNPVHPSDVVSCTPTSPQTANGGSSEPSSPRAIEKDESSNEVNQEFKLPPLPDTPPRVCGDSNIIASLSDGVLLSYSAVPPLMEISNSAKVNEILSKLTKEFSESASQPVTVAPPKSPKGKKGKRDDDQKQQGAGGGEQGRNESDEAKKMSERCAEIERILTIQESTKNIYISTPNGVRLSFKHGILFHDYEQHENNVRTFLVKQERVLNEKQEVTLENCDRVTELYRCITSDGLVMKFNSDETVEVLSATGDIYHSTPFKIPLSQSDETSSQQTNNNESKPNAEPILAEPARNVSTPTRGKKGSALKQSKDSAPLEAVEAETIVPNEEGNEESSVTWNMIEASGEQWRINSEGEKESLEELLVADASCFETDQVLRTREDGVLIVNRHDGTRIVEYLDGTRVTTSLQSRCERIVDQETGERVDKEIFYTTITIEHAFYPTTTLDLSTSSITCSFPNGREITAFHNGGCVVSKKENTDLVISSQGEISVHPSHPVSNNNVILPTNTAPNSCILKQTLQNALHLVDCHGNCFQVDANGDYRIEKSESSEDQELESSSSTGMEPRYFVVYPDGSGEELLQYEDVAQYIGEAEYNPSVAMLHGSVEGDDESTTITIIRPHEGHAEDVWKSVKKENNIIPISLRERDFKSFAKKKKSNNEDRKTSMKTSPLSFDSRGVGKSIKPQVKCPDMLEIRHLIHHQPLTADLRKEIIDGINQYGDYVAKQQDQQDHLRTFDERPDDERTTADLVKERFLQKEAMKNDEAEKIIADQYVSALLPPKPPSPRRPKPERPAEEWAKDKEELKKCEHQKYMIRTKDLPPYFQTDEGKRFLLDNPPNMKPLCDQLAEETKHPVDRSYSSSSSQAAVTPQEKLPVGHSTPNFDHSSPDLSSSMSMKYGDASILSMSPNESSLSTGRPLNPTPQKAKIAPIISGGGVSMIESKLEPIDESKSNFVDDDVALDKSNCSTDEMTKSLLYDVSGSPRKEKVKTPSSILGSRPNAVPNDKFSETEGPVRRQIKTASVYGSVDPSSISKLRGFVLVPDVVDFGVLTEGFTYTYPVTIKNVGVDSCRFKIKQPPPSTGLNIVYKPGLVAAGMQTTFDVEIFAIAVGVEGNCGGVGQISHHLEIITETDILYLPVIASIITQHELENPSQETSQGGPSKSALLLLDKRPSSREMLRPRKE